MTRVPDPGRFELRLMDGAANPYLMQAGILAAGLDGIANNSEPGARLARNLDTDGHNAKGPKNPTLNRLDAISANVNSHHLTCPFSLSSYVICF